MSFLGPDTCTLVRRVPTGGLDGTLQPAYSEVTVTKGNSCVTIVDGSSVTSAPVASAGIGGADSPEGSVAIYSMKAILPVDGDTTVLTGDDALLFDGLLFELSRPANTKYTLRGAPDHVRVFGTAMYNTAKSAEQVTVTPRGGRDDSGQPRPDGVPYNVMAYAVTADKSEAAFYLAGNLDTVDLTVALPIGTPIRDNDWVTARGRTGYARVRDDLGRWTDRDVRVVTVHAMTGGRNVRGVTVRGGAG